MTLVVVLATTTWHYRTRVINVANKKKELHGNFQEIVGSFHEEPVFVGSSVNFSGSIHSQHSYSDFQDLVSMPRKSQNYKSCENLLQGMPSTQHVEIGGEAFYHHGIQADDECYS